MKCDSQTVKTISYGNPGALVLLWLKALLLMPLWAIPLVAIAGFVCRSLGSTALQIGHGAILVFCAAYFLQDLLKRRIRLEQDYLFFGFRAIDIREIASVDVAFKAKKLLPAALVLMLHSGQTLRLNLNGLSEESVETLLKHIQSRNSTVSTAPMLATLVRCKRSARKKPVLNVAGRLEVPYRSRHLWEETVEAFLSSARQWLRLGPAVACLLAAPVWIGFVSTVYMSLQPNTALQLESLNLHDFVCSLFSGLIPYVAHSIVGAHDALKASPAMGILFLVSSAVLASVLIYMQSLFLRPNRVVADSQGLSLNLRVGDFSLTYASIDWKKIDRVDLVRKQASAGPGKMQVATSDGKKLELDLAAIAHEDRTALLRRIETLAPACLIDPELSQSMLQKSARSYTEIWLQSLTEAPQRKLLEPLHPGQLVGECRYEVLRQLGTGGQGTAYLCERLDSDSGQTVMLKETIVPIFVEDAVRRNAIEKFEREVKLLETLDSERIVKLLDYFIEDHRAYLVLEHIDGQSLRQIVLAEGALQADRVRELAWQMCEMLEFLHSHSVVHRDFTPDNLILTPSGELKLIDFNVAHQQDSESGRTVVGKHAYLPPEQFRGKACPQSDLYAFGATMFFLLTGQDPEPISQSSPSSVVAGVDEELDRIVRRATALNLDKRYTDASEIQADLLFPPDEEDQEAVVSIGIAERAEDLAR